MGSTGKIDINHAAPEDMEILAGIDHSVARSIVDYRAFHHFKEMEDLEKIPGIGKGSLRKLKASVWFSSEEEVKGKPPTKKGKAEKRTGRKKGSDGQVAINRAGSEELMSLPSIGERTAEAIISYRREHGEFRSPEDMEKIPGIGPRMMEKLRDKILF